MVAYSFQAQFAEMVAEWRKRQTIRAPRRRHARVGERVQLYADMRFKTCRKLVTPDPVCVSVRPITLDTYAGSGGLIRRVSPGGWFPVSDGFAREDGFESWTLMRDWFKETHGLPFHGVLIEWRAGGDDIPNNHKSTRP